MASIKPNSKFAPDASAEIIRKALSGCGTNEKKLIEVLSTHTNCQRQEIKRTYHTKYARDLVTDLKSDVGGAFGRMVLALMEETNVYLSNEILHAMKGLGTDEGALIEILCTRSSAEVAAIKNHYKESFGRDMAQDIFEETSGDFKKLLEVTLNLTRCESPDVDHTKAVHDAKALYDAGAGRLGTNEEMITSILCSRSFVQLRAIFTEYEKLTGNDIEKDLRSETSGDLKSAYVALVKFARDAPTYFAERIYKSIKGAGTNDGQLTRIIVTRSEIDLAATSAAYYTKYGVRMREAIIKETKGDYRRLLLAVIGDN